LKGKTRSKSPNKKKSRRSRRDEVPPVPPLPPIPENLRPSITPRIFDRIVRRMRSHSEIDEEKDEGKDEDELNLTPRLDVGFPEMRKLSVSKRRPLLKCHISNPELILGSHSNFHLSHGDLTAGANYVGQQQADASSSGHLDPQNSRPMSFPTRTGSRFTYNLAKPRLSPMEYTRLYLIEKALSEREGRSCELPKPENRWFWTPRWEKFFIIPIIPSCIRRDFALRVDKIRSSSGVNTPKQDESDNESVATIKPETRKSTLPRLSLNLGRMSVLYPSILDIIQPRLDEAQSIGISIPQTSPATQDRNAEVGIGGQEIMLHGDRQLRETILCAASRIAPQMTRDELVTSQSLSVHPHSSHSQQ
jgi:serine/arginine repetitive matrix protein 2